MLHEKEKKAILLYHRNGIFYVRIWDENTGSYTSAKSTKQSDRDLAILKAQQMIENGAIRKRENDPLFTDLILEYWKSREKSISPKYYKGTINFLEKYVVKFTDLQKVKMSQVKAAIINRFIDSLKTKELTPRTINRIIQPVKTFLKWSYSRDHIQNDITPKIEKLKENLRKRGFLEPEEVFKLAVLEWDDQRVKAAVMLSVFAGTRKGELRSLQWRDIDFKNNTIHIRRNFVDEYGENGKPIFKEPKTGSERKFPYLKIPELKNALLTLWEETPFRGPDDLLFINIWNTKNPGQLPISKTTLKRGFVNMMDSIGIDREERKRRNLVFHGLRTYIRISNVRRAACRVCYATFRTYDTGNVSKTTVIQ